MSHAQNKQLEDQLWGAAEHMRANSSLKLNEISEPILGLIFLKFADVKFQATTKILESERDSSSGRLRPIGPDDYKSKGVLFLPESATFSYLLNLPENEDLGKAVNEAMKTIEENNHDLAGVLPQEFNNLSRKADENNRILIALLKNFNNIPNDLDGDSFGRIYEFFLGKFALAEGQDGGEFFTAQPIVKLIVEILEPYHGRIYDPACGSGGMFIQSAEFVRRHTKSHSPMDEVAIYGQEKTDSTVKIATMNLAIHGLSGDIKLTNSYYENPFASVSKFDFVLANPPFNVKGKDKSGQLVIDPARIKGDPRYMYGLPLTQKGELTNANYLWIQMFESALSEKGRAGFVMANSACDAGNSEKEIRRKLIDSGIVDVMISVGSNMFLNVTLSCTLWFFDKGKQGTARQNEVLFINAQDIVTPIDRAHNTWTEDQIQEIANIVRRYRGEEGAGEYTDIKGRCKVATLEEIKANDYSLNPGRYIEIENTELDVVDFKAKMAELLAEFTNLTAQAHELEDKIKEDWKKIL